MKLKRILSLDETWESKLLLFLTVVEIVAFVWWGLTVRGYFEQGYYEGIENCFSQEGFTEMFAHGKAMYGNYFNLSREETERFFINETGFNISSFFEDT